MAAAAMRDSYGIVRNLANLVRIRDWWEFKLAPLAGLFYAAAAATGAPLLPLLPQALLLLAAVAVCAVLVSLLNDATDVAVDRSAGKPNPMDGRTTAAKAGLLALPALAGVGVAALWRDDPPLVASYLGSFVAFLLYSAPPVRLKGRGALGAGADAAGAHLLPTLTAVLLAARATRTDPDALLLGLAGIWAFAFGLRGIVWHQLGDREADRRAGVRTLVRAWGSAAARRIGTLGALPVELAGLALLLWRTGAVLAALSLALYLGLLLVRYRRLGVAPAPVQHRPGEAILLHRYYGFWLPAAIILQSALHHPADLALLLLHAILFPGGTRRAAAELWHVRPSGVPLAAR
jgi:4-hydroxybenzoate polyprenyltransferase